MEIRYILNEIIKNLKSKYMILIYYKYDINNNMILIII